MASPSPSTPCAPTPFFSLHSLALDAVAPTRHRSLALDAVRSHSLYLKQQLHGHSLALGAVRSHSDHHFEQF